MLYQFVSKNSAVILAVFLLLLLSSCQTVSPVKVNGSTVATIRPDIDRLSDPKDAFSDTDDNGIPELIAPSLKAVPGAVSQPIEVFNSNSSDTVVRELYSVVADQVPVKDILASIARDATAQVDFIGDISGLISLSVVNQPLDYILRQITTQVAVRYEISDGRILLIEDKPFVRSYEVDYLNMQRLSESRVDLATQIGSIRTDIDGSGNAQGGSNGSQLFVENKSENSLWSSVVRSIGGILGEGSDVDAGSGEFGSKNVFVNPESGIVTVRARQSQHAIIEKLIKRITRSAQRQVLIEATVVEVALNDNYESGVDWQVLNDSGSRSSQFSQILAGLPDAASAITPVTALFSYSDSNSILGNLSSTLKLLQQFGEVQVLSSPKIIAMNNQPAVLKVVDNRVYFTFEVNRLERENGDERTVVDSTVHSVPVGLVMNVTPFISRDREVILNVRPTISRILNFAEDPSPALAGQSEVRNLIPEIQVREMESLLRVQSGSVAIIGGLMQNKIDNRTAGVPGLKRLPVLGRLFSHDVRNIEKTELLVFLKPTVLDQKFDGIP